MSGVCLKSRQCLPGHDRYRRQAALPPRSGGTVIPLARSGSVADGGDFSSGPSLRSLIAYDQVRLQALMSVIMSKRNVANIFVK
jgi:hypothetical protein